MTSSTTEQPEQPSESAAPRSRRGVLAAGAAGILGAIGAALGRPATVDAAVGDPLLIGQQNFAGTSATRLSATSSGGAFWMTQNGTGSGVRGDSTSGHGGVFATSHIGRYGLYAQNNAIGNAGEVGSGAAVRAIGNYSVGVHGASSADAGVRGITTAEDPAGVEGTGLLRGVRGTAIGPTGTEGIGVNGEGTQFGVLGSSTAGAGVYGESDSGSGVRGLSSAGYGVFGASASSYAGWFDGPVMVDGRVQLSGYADLSDTTIPGNPAGGARLFARTSMGKYELCVIFASGTIHIISSEDVPA